MLHLVKSGSASDTRVSTLISNVSQINLKLIKNYIIIILYYLLVCRPKMINMNFIIFKDAITFVLLLWLFTLDEDLT